MSHNGHNLHSTSRLQNWIEHELIHLATLDEEEIIETDLPDRSLSLRVPVATHLMLYRIAQKLGRSKTACAEEILDIAVRDVYKQIELPPLTAEDIQEYAQQTEKTAAGEGSGCGQFCEKKLAVAEAVESPGTPDFTSPC